MNAVSIQKECACVNTNASTSNKVESSAAAPIFMDSLPNMQLVPVRSTTPIHPSYATFTTAGGEPIGSGIKRYAEALQAVGRFKNPQDAMVCALAGVATYVPGKFQDLRPMLEIWSPNVQNGEAVAVLSGFLAKDASNIGPACSANALVNAIGESAMLIVRRTPDALPVWGSDLEQIRPEALFCLGRDRKTSTFLLRDESGCRVADTLSTVILVTDGKLPGDLREAAFSVKVLGPGPEPISDTRQVRATQLNAHEKLKHDIALWGVTNGRHVQRRANEIALLSDHPRVRNSAVLRAIAELSGDAEVESAYFEALSRNALETDLQPPSYTTPFQYDWIDEVLARAA
jgi:hypothetical protein